MSSNILFFCTESNRIEDVQCSRGYSFPACRPRIDTRPRIADEFARLQDGDLTIDRVIAAERVLRGTRLFDESCSREIGKLITLVSRGQKEREKEREGE